MRGYASSMLHVSETKGKHHLLKKVYLNHNMSKPSTFRQGGFSYYFLFTWKIKLTMYNGFWIMDPRSWILDPKSWIRKRPIPDSGSRGQKTMGSTTLNLFFFLTWTSAKVKLVFMQHHFLLHYPRLILEYGPPLVYSTLRFEARHRYGFVPLTELFATHRTLRIRNTDYIRRILICNWETFFS